MKMRDSTVITHADVYIGGGPSTSKADSVMRPGHSPPPMQASIPSGYDIPDDASIPGTLTRPAPAIATSVKPLHPNGESDTEVIEEAVPINHKTLPSPEPQPKVEHNGIDHKLSDEKKLVHDPDDDPCIIKCVYFAQQCCECRIL